MTASSYGVSYTSRLSYHAIEEKDFHEDFVKRVKSFAANPTKSDAVDFIHLYGTHYIQEAELGGRVYRTIFFDSQMDREAAKSYTSEATEAGFEFMFMKSENSKKTSDTTENSSGSEISVYRTGTKLKGVSKAKDFHEFCDNLLNESSPTVMKFKNLMPLWEFFSRIDGVDENAGEVMKGYVMSFFADGNACARKSCQGQMSICSWETDE